MPILENPQHELFAQHYMILRDPRLAADAAGFSAGSNPKATLAIPGVVARIQELLAPEIAQATITAPRVMRELARVAFQDVRDLYDRDGNMIPPHLLSDDAAATIAGIDVEVRYRRGRPSSDEDDPDNPREEVVTKKIRRVDKMAALGILARHFKIVGEDNEGVNALASALADRLKTGRQRAYQRPAASQPVEDARIIDPTPLPPATQETAHDELWQ